MTTTNTSYKDSGIAWIGQIPEMWDLMKAKYCTKIIPGYAYKAEEYIEKDGIPLIRIGDITDTIVLDEAKQVPMKYIDITPGMIIKRDDILVALTGATIGKSTLYDLDEIALLNQRNAIIRPLSDMNGRFLFYFVKSESFRKFIDFECYGGAQENVSTSQIGNMFISLPPLPTQTTIATYLDTKTTQISEFITKKKQLISLLTEQKQAIIHQAVTKGIDPTAVMKDSGIAWIGQIPEEWDLMKAKYCTKIIPGYAYKAEEYIEKDGIPLIRIGDITDIIVLDEAKQVPMKYIDITPGMIIKKDDILIALTGATIGKSTLYNLDEIALLNQRTAIVRPLNKMNGRFLFYFVKSESFRKFIDFECYGGAQENVSTSQIGNMFISIPPLPTQTAIVSYIESRTSKIDQAITKIEQEINLIQEYRTSLIYHAVTGKINIQ